MSDKSILLRVPSDLAYRLDALSSSTEVSRTKFIIACIQAGLSGRPLLDTLPITVSWRETLETTSEWCAGFPRED
jgi:hypothetical protein